MLGFKDWLKTTDYRAINDIRGKLVSDILIDSDFPHACERYVILCYLGNRLDSKQKLIFDELYAEYIRYISREFSDDPVE